MSWYFKNTVKKYIKEKQQQINSYTYIGTQYYNKISKIPNPFDLWSADVYRFEGIF